MKRRSRYADEVIAYTLAQRAKGVKWKEVTRGIKEEFGITPPSERQMRDWYMEMGVSSADPERVLRERLLQVTRATTPFAIFTAQKQLFQKGIPELVEAWGRNEDPWIAGGTMVLSMLEQTVGAETYDEITRRYEKVRRQRKEQPVGIKEQQGLPPGWVREEARKKEGRA